MMNNIKKLTILLFALGVLSACETEVAEHEEQVKSVNIETEQVETEVFESYLRLVGTVITNSDVQVAAEVSGRITEVRKNEGEVVRKGETVVKVDDRKLQQEFNRLRATTEQSRENYERLQRLYEEENIGSEIDYLNAKYGYEQNRAALESIKVDLENTSISAPFPGSVESIFTEAGEMVSPGTPVFRLINRDDKRVLIGVPARYSGAVDLGDNTEVWFDFDPDTKYQLPVTFVGSAIDPRNRTFEVEIKLPVDISQIKVDMIANVRLRTERIEEAIVVSEQYIFQKEGNDVVYVLNQNEQGEPIASQKIVSLGSAYGNAVVVEDGLNAGDELITLGASYLQDGSRVFKAESDQSEMASNKENGSE
ncbi:efflux RND transporter periplasmic adaptor subunit [Rhodohalobacter sp. 614A]|uniref:efflux RND transporter periplasmic adaptor subunit n=1 Tax=Rhodohalobacter sp. 614A TaxID=2908649 RepID=UPI001F33DBAA|nr:efflux RND transporter periplasmic adaptor subunit [Rhodohalobacter sp. 614A]